MSSHVLAVAGAKGGVGKTTTSINLGAAFADRGANVIVVEADLAMANAVDFLKLDFNEETDPSLHEVLAGRASVGAAIYRAPGGIDILPCGVELEGYSAADPSALSAVVDKLDDHYDIIVLDTGAGLSRETLIPMGLADEVVVVSTPRVASVRDAEKTIELAQRVGSHVAGILFSMSGTGRAPPPERIAQYLTVEYLGHVPEDGAVPTSQDSGRPVVIHAAESSAGRAYREIADKLIGILTGKQPPSGESQEPQGSPTAQPGGEGSFTRGGGSGDDDDSDSGAGGSDGSGIIPNVSDRPPSSGG